MSTITRVQKPFHSEFLSPGSVGSVGDALQQVKLKHSFPDADLRFALTDAEMSAGGSNVQNGSTANYEGNGIYRCLDSNWGGNRDMKTAIGWEHQDLRAPDKRYEPAVAPSFSSYDNLKYHIYESKRTGDKFLPLPGGYEPPPGNQSRGAAPVITALAGGDFTPQPSVITKPVLDQNPTDARRAPGVGRQAGNYGIVGRKN